MAKKKAKKKAVKKSAKKSVKKTAKKTVYELPPVTETVATTETPVEETKPKKLGKHETIMEHFMKSHEVMKSIKSQFGYSGYSNPNYIGLAKQIDENEILIESLK